VKRDVTYENVPRARDGDSVRGAIATAYAAGMIYAGGMRFFLASAPPATPAPLPGPAGSR
jgi:arginine:ornithine antiporter/lysine permease